MSRMELPAQYLKIKKKYKEYFKALNNLGKVSKMHGPITEKNCHLIQLAAAVSIRSEGAVHSHVRRAIESGANQEEIYQAILLLTSTIGFPTVSAALSWVDDILENR